jgi:hypothetical protein
MESMVGKRVKIKSLPWGFMHVKFNAEYAGETLTILSMAYDIYCGWRYKMKECPKLRFSDEMIEGLAPTFEERSKKYFKSIGGSGEWSSMGKLHCRDVRCSCCMFNFNGCDKDCAKDSIKMEQLLTDWEKEQDMFKKDDLRTDRVYKTKDGNICALIEQGNKSLKLMYWTGKFLKHANEEVIAYAEVDSFASALVYIWGTWTVHEWDWEATTPAKQKALDRLAKAKEAQEEATKSQIEAQREVAAATKLVEDM